MPKNVPNVQAVLTTARDIISKHNGKVLYPTFRAELDATLPNNDAALQQIIKNRMLPMFLEGIDSNMQPLLYVMAELPKG